MTMHPNHSSPVTYELAGRPVHRIGYGAMQLPRLSSDRGVAVALIRRAVDSGVDHVDTAQFYGDDAFANDVLREALAGSDVLVATKIGADPNPGGAVHLRPAQRPDELRVSVEDNLRSLGRELLDLVYLRRIDLRPGIVATGDAVVPIEDQLAVMVDMRDAGKIGAIGLSAVSQEQLEVALPAGIAAVQNAYSLIDTTFEPVLSLCARENVAWVPFFPLGSAFPTMPSVADDPTVRRVAADLGVTPTQVGLAWLLRHASNTLLVPGTASTDHLQENLAAGAVGLPRDTLGELDAVSRR